MGHRFYELMFSSQARAIQTESNSRTTYQRLEQGADRNSRLSDHEINFIEQRKSLYMATVTHDGWPYLQHRGGPAGFIKVLDHQHIGFADYRGNRQYISTANLRGNNRVSLFLMDYPNRRRLKMLGYAEEIAIGCEAQIKPLIDSEYSGVVERGFIIKVAAFDWNCSQHITPRFEAERYADTQSIA